MELNPRRNPDLLLMLLFWGTFDVHGHTARTMSERAALPDLDTLNHEALKALIVAQHAQILSKGPTTCLARRRVSRAEELPHDHCQDQLRHSQHSGGRHRSASVSRMICSQRPLP
jgi:hypothetical protein